MLGHEPRLFAVSLSNPHDGKLKCAFPAHAGRQRRAPGGLWAYTPHHLCVVVARVRPYCHLRIALCHARTSLWLQHPLTIHHPSAAHTPRRTRRYACFYVTRTCFNYVNPLMLKDAALGVDLTAVGFISSLLPIAYAFSKGISGFLGSTMSPRLLLSGGLAATGLTCLGFGFGQGVTWFAAFWTLNGLLQVRCTVHLADMSCRTAP